MISFTDNEIKSNSGKLERNAVELFTKSSAHTVLFPSIYNVGSGETGGRDHTEIYTALFQFHLVTFWIDSITSHSACVFFLLHETHFGRNCMWHGVRIVKCFAAVCVNWNKMFALWALDEYWERCVFGYMRMKTLLWVMSDIYMKRKLHDDKNHHLLWHM